MTSKPSDEAHKHFAAMLRAYIVHSDVNFQAAQRQLIKALPEAEAMTDTDIELLEKAAHVVSLFRQTHALKHAPWEAGKG